MRRHAQAFNLGPLQAGASAAMWWFRILLGAAAGQTVPMFAVLVTPEGSQTLQRASSASGPYLPILPGARRPCNQSWPNADPFCQSRSPGSVPKQCSDVPCTGRPASEAPQATTWLGSQLHGTGILWQDYRSLAHMPQIVGLSGASEICRKEGGPML